MFFLGCFTDSRGVHCVMVLPVFGRNRPEGKILETVGVFEAVKQHGKYETGQVRRHTHTKWPPAAIEITAWFDSSIFHSVFKF